MHRRLCPGGSGIIIVRDFANDTTVDLAANAPSWFTNGPVGAIDDATFGGGTSSSHGHVDLATLPPGAIPLLTNGNPNQIVAFVYPYGNGPYGNGHVFDTPFRWTIALPAK